MKKEKLKPATVEDSEGHMGTTKEPERQKDGISTYAIRGPS